MLLNHLLEHYIFKKPYSLAEETDTDMNTKSKEKSALEYQNGSLSGAGHRGDKAGKPKRTVYR